MGLLDFVFGSSEKQPQQGGLLGVSNPLGGLLNGGYAERQQMPAGPQMQQEQYSPPGIQVGFGFSDPTRYALAQLAGIIAGPNSGAGEYAKTIAAQKSEFEKMQRPFGGESFDSQLVRQRAREYMQAGVPQQEAISRAANDVLGTKQDYVADPTNPGALIPVGRKALPPVQAQGQVPQMQVPAERGAPIPTGTPVTLRGPNGEAPVAVSSGPLLPPPSSTQAPGMPASVFNPAAMNPYQPQTGAGALQGDIEASKEGAKAGVQVAADIREQIKQLRAQEQNLASILDVAGEAFSPVGMPVSWKQNLTRLTGAGGDVARQNAATAQIMSMTAETVGPMLKTLAGAGAISNAEADRAVKVYSDPNSLYEERVAVLQPLLEKTRGKIETLSGGQGRKVDYKGALPGEAKVLRYNPQTGNFE